MRLYLSKDANSKCTALISPYQCKNVACVLSEFHVVTTKKGSLHEYNNYMSVGESITAIIFEVDDV